MAEWLSLHIFESGDLDSFLVDRLLPAVRAFREEGLIERWFFLRYWNGGPHIRCRLECTAGTDTLHRRVAAELGLRVSDQARESGGPDSTGSGAEASAALERRLAGDSGALLEEVEPLQPAGTVQRRRFALDPLRFGGPERSEQALSHFCVSSDIAATLSPHVRNRRAELHAIALHFAAETVRSLLLHGEDPQEAMAVLAAQMPDSKAAADRDWADPETQPGLADRIDAHLRSGPPLAGASPRFNRCLETWQGEMAALGGELHGPEGTIASVAIDFLHLLNNRLGLTGFEEFYLYALLARALEFAEAPAPALPGRAA